jgi:MoaA/NifB/PqqE/SkfB family radical SAM enzyme
MNPASDAYRLYRIGRAVLSPRIEYVILFVTARCNLLCKHCFYIDEIRNAKKKRELTLDEYERIATKLGHVLNVSLTGGEPFLRADLGEIVRVFHRSARTMFFNVTTNGLLPQRILPTVEGLFVDCPALSLRLGVSIDGFEEVHDRTRGRVGGFQQALATIEALQPLRRRYPNFTVHVSTTLTRDNAPRIREFIDFVAQTLDVDAHYLGYIRGNVVLEPGLKEVPLADYRAATTYLGHKWVTRAKYQNLLNVITTLKDGVNRYILENDAYFFQCVAGRKMITIDEEGKVKPCEMLEQMGITPYVMGDLRECDYDAYRVLQTATGRAIRDRIVDEKCYCTFECANLCNVGLKPTNFVRAAGLYAIQSLRGESAR